MKPVTIALHAGLLASWPPLNYVGDITVHITVFIYGKNKETNRKYKSLFHPLFIQEGPVETQDLFFDGVFVQNGKIHQRHQDNECNERSEHQEHWLKGSEHSLTNGFLWFPHEGWIKDISSQWVIWCQQFQIALSLAFTVDVLTWRWSYQKLGQCVFYLCVF